MMNGGVDFESQPFTNAISTTNSTDYQSESVPDSVMSNGTDGESEIKIPKHEVLELTFNLVHCVGLWLFKNVQVKPPEQVRPTTRCG